MFTNLTYYQISMPQNHGSRQTDLYTKRYYYNLSMKRAPADLANSGVPYIRGTVFQCSHGKPLQNKIATVIKPHTNRVQNT